MLILWREGRACRRFRPMRIDGKVVLITGASEGIGAACAAEFAASGAKLALNARNKEKLSAAAPKGSLLEPLFVTGDVTVDADRRSMIDRTIEHYGAIDILINNAGAGFYQPSWEMPLDEVRLLMDLNFFAPLALTQLAVPHMRERRSGMIVNVGSIAGKVPLPWMSIYSVSKYALGALTDCQRVELKRDGIHTLIVCPGYVKTNFQQNARSGQTPDKVRDAKRFAISAETCARAIRHGVEREARTVVTPRAGWLLVLAMRLFPSFVESRMAALNGTA
jgi:short-subunit dehydrogenase